MSARVVRTVAFSPASRSSLLDEPVAVAAKGAVDEANNTVKKNLDFPKKPSIPAQSLPSPGPPMSERQQLALLMKLSEDAQTQEDTDNANSNNNNNNNNINNNNNTNNTNANANTPTPAASISAKKRKPSPGVVDCSPARVHGIWRPVEFARWTPERRRRWQEIAKNPAEYYYHHLAPGLLSRAGQPWASSEVRQLLRALLEHPSLMKKQWGFMAFHVYGRTGQECEAQFKQLIKDGLILSGGRLTDRGRHLLSHLHERALYEGIAVIDKSVHDSPARAQREESPDRSPAVPAHYSTSLSDSEAANFSSGGPQLPQPREARKPKSKPERKAAQKPADAPLDNPPATPAPEPVRQRIPVFCLPAPSPRPAPAAFEPPAHSALPALRFHASQEQREPALSRRAILQPAHTIESLSLLARVSKHRAAAASLSSRVTPLVRLARFEAHEALASRASQSAASEGVAPGIASFAYVVQAQNNPAGAESPSPCNVVSSSSASPDDALVRSRVFAREVARQAAIDKYIQEQTQTFLNQQYDIRQTEKQP